MTPVEDGLATSVVVVNYRTKELTLEAVRSALREPEVHEVVIVDNSSGDGSADFLRASLSAPNVRLIDSAANIGFGRAVNLAMPSTTCDLVLLLNSDATLVPGAVAKLGGTLLGDATVGLVAPAVYEADGRSLEAGAYGPFPRMSWWPFDRDRHQPSASTPDWVSGVAMMMRRDDFVELGGFDPDFGMYLEDVDLCRRLRRLGKVVRREPAAGVVHLGGKSWTSSVDKRSSYQRSKVTYFRKSGLPPPKLAVLQVLRAVRVGAAWCAARFRGRRGPRA